MIDLNRKRIRAIVRNLLILAGLGFLCLRLLGYYRDPIRLFRYSEESLNYGPSEIVHRQEDSHGNIFILSRYGRYFYVASLERRLGFFYSMGSQSIVEDQGGDLELNISYRGESDQLVVAGLVNNPAIDRVILRRAGEDFPLEDFYGKIFFQVFRMDLEDQLKILGLGAGGQLIFERDIN